MCTSASSAGEPKSITNSLGMTFIELPAGEFLRGSPDDDAEADDDERPQRLVRITRSFALGRCEVSQAEYQRVMGENPSWFSREGGGRGLVRGIDTSRHPVEMVSWYDAGEFCRRLAKLPEEQAAGRKYRLPTEAEWEYAACAGGSRRFGAVDELPLEAGNFRYGERPPITLPIGSFRANAWGFHDLHGNVWEWCSDWYAADYYSAAPTDDPQGPTDGNGRVVRGGDYLSPPTMTRCANRDFTRPSRRDWGNGLRVVLELR
jgi:formylglycine-generating enzyme required for sulfatase activity